MKNNKGFAPIAIVLIIIAVLAVGGVAYFAGKSSNSLPQNVVPDNYQSSGNQTNVAIPPVQNTEADCLPNTAPWIKVLSPAGGEVYTVGQNVNVEWTSCNVDKVFVAWAQGGHDKGLLSGETPISANQGSYRWIVPHADPSLPNSGFWIAVEKAVPQQNNQWTSGILAKSGNFSIQ